MRTIAVTGANGFVGTALVCRLAATPGVHVRAIGGGDAAERPAGVADWAVLELSEEDGWGEALQGVDAVVHLAARVHVMRDTAANPLAVFRRVNVDGTLALARRAAAAGVQRLVYLSSVKVHGETGTFTEESPLSPVDPYGRSKQEAEEALRQVAHDTALKVSIVRPPLVYGPGVRANFEALMRAVARGVPLPFGSVRNTRSLVALDNLVDLIVTCLDHPAAANQTFLAGDDRDLSTADLIRGLARAMGKPARLIPVPVPVLMGAAALLGRGDAARRLLGSMQVSPAKARRLLGWSPPISVEEGLRRAVQPGRPS